jgi:hypothetical protein
VPLQAAQVISLKSTSRQRSLPHPRITRFPSSMQTSLSQTEWQGTEGEGVIMKRPVG